MGRSRFYRNFAICIYLNILTRQFFEIIRRFLVIRGK